MRIADAAREIGVAEHVLRHWDDIGAVSPERTAAGHRDYSDEHLHRLRVLRACQEVGMSLAEIRLVLHRDESGRTEVITRQREHLRAQRERLEDAERFLAHVIDCRHDLLTRCPECSLYGDPGPPA
ncbi:MerR family transcriptional regulator [Brachybacterium sacelli]|uniref:MerR family gold-responsive transcriptional activator of gol and ges genes n=1 Tax=Brachybacterium sacelli TaxID=173364 RepID=A0ABS4WVX8_9MICO|nr:MerR family transcriptional regulator [Brachybacterium sacelli]MBP2380362.1 MerR family gold-responsive transcriptional activator of gol and ges genes [Brachybacterium sacelli]